MPDRSHDAGLPHTIVASLIGGLVVVMEACTWDGNYLAAGDGGSTYTCCQISRKGKHCPLALQRRKGYETD